MTPIKPRHINNGHCTKCQEVFDRYPGFHGELRTWFEYLQTRFPDAHISCAGRGKAEQEMWFHKKTSRARWKESAHNWNAAIDIFQLVNGEAHWSADWFNATVREGLKWVTAPMSFTWYGVKGARYFELPHVEVTGWRQNPHLKLVEDEEKTNG